jgi:hypothetical protein
MNADRGWGQAGMVCHGYPSALLQLVPNRGTQYTISRPSGPGGWEDIELNVSDGKVIFQTVWHTLWQYLGK